MYFKVLSACWMIIFLAKSTTSQDEKRFVDYFAKCKLNAPGFNDCMRDALNNVRRFFKSGVPELNIIPFDPFHVKEVLQVRGIDPLNYKLKLKDVTESGWTQSRVTKFKCDIDRRRVQYTQFFPEKFLEGKYEIEGNLASSNMKNSGVWNITLYDYVQTTTITWPKDSKQLKVIVDIQKIGNLDLHISNLLGGRSTLETILGRIINQMWSPGFPFVRPLINDLVSTAFTEIFTNAFKQVDILNDILPH